MPTRTATVERGSTRASPGGWTAAWIIGLAWAGGLEGGELRVGGAETNDLVKALVAAQVVFVRCETPRAAIESAEPGDGVLLLADGYPERKTEVDASLFEVAGRKKLRVYVEYPSWLPGGTTHEAQTAQWERGVVTSGFFGAALPEFQLLALHDCRFVPLKADRAHLRLARVAGYDTAVFGLPKEAHPLLFEIAAGVEAEAPPVLVAATKLSRFRQARYGPVEAWSVVWGRILTWLSPAEPRSEFRIEPVVRPSYAAEESLPAEAERRALARGIAWFERSGMLLRPADLDVYQRPANALGQPDAIWPLGHRVGPRGAVAWSEGSELADGSLGVLEGFDARILPDGSQPVRWWRRGDCNGEVAGAFALASRVLGEARYGRIGGNLADWFYRRSIMSQGNRALASHPAFGLTGWNDVPDYYGTGQDGYAVYYADDNARAMLGMMQAAAALGTDRYDERLMRCLLANLRLSGRLGFQPDRIDEAPLVQRGWRAYFNDTNTSYSPHYQAYLWACHLWAYQQTRYELFRERARTAIRRTMAVYPGGWVWTNGMQQERARMLLALAWLVRVDDGSDVRAWLDRIAGDLLAAQDACGAIREELGVGGGGFPPPASNEAYGTSEAPLIQQNGDPACDLLYTMNFAFLGLHEAAAATGDARLRRAEDRLAAFLCRIQAASRERPELDGAWFRAFDFRRWEYWGSGADAGWGAWCVETGWTQSWITSVLALRQLDTSFWEFTAGSGVGRAFRGAQALLLPGVPGQAKGRRALQDEASHE